jgi:putative Holliday junction resolvase
MHKYIDLPSTIANWMSLELYLYRMGRKLAIDFGLKRTGLAVTDSANIIASPLETVDSKDLIARLKVLVIQMDIDVLVVGEPKNLDTSDTHISANVRLLEEVLRKEFPKVKVVLIDERFTSSMALQSLITAGSTKKQRREKGVVDRVSAAIILQSYLDRLG